MTELNCVGMDVCLCVCMCACLYSQRRRERERDGASDRYIKEFACVHVQHVNLLCVCDKVWQLLLMC